MKTKEKSEFQKKRERRDKKIRGLHEEVPELTLAEMASALKCSVSTVYYAIHGRKVER